ncbi:MAG TPA: tetratricopeptide repeat protein, partial [Ktedonobacteraceae bacterium]
MSEQEKRQPSTDSGVELTHFYQMSPSGNIQAETIIANNVVSGIQINYHSSSEPSQKIMPPLQHPPQVEHFVDREWERAKFLADLKPGRVVAICGPGGMGKTALVAEILWTLAPGDIPPEDFPDGIFFYSFYGQPNAVIALEQIARTFGEEPLPTPALAAQRALSRRQALLVLDGADEADQLKLILDLRADNAVLVTSRRREDALDLVYRLDLKPLPGEEAVTLLQALGGKRATNKAIITQICKLVGYLPLAVRLAGRYLANQEEEAGEYLEWLRETPLSALDQGQSQRESIPVLLEHSIAKLSVESQDILSVVGLLALAPFNRDLIIGILEVSRDTVRRALGELVNYDLLVRREQLYEVSHQLIHTYARYMLETRIDPVRQQILVERMILVLSERFPSVEYPNWGACEELIPQVQAAATKIEEDHLTFIKAASLLDQAGGYARERARYAQAEFFLQLALAIAEEAGDSASPILSSILNNLVLLYQDLGKYAQGIPYAQRALAIDEKVHGPDHRQTAASLNNLAQLYQFQGEYTQAEPLFLRALKINENKRGRNHPNTARALKNVAEFYRVQGKFIQAEPYYQRALAIWEKEPESDLPYTAIFHNNLALFYHNLREYTQAEPLFLQSLAIDEEVHRSDHPNTAYILNNLALLYQDLGKYTQAE